MIDIVLLIVLLIFIGQNLESVRVSFLFIGFNLPLVILIALVFIVYYTAKAFEKKEAGIKRK